MFNPHNFYKSTAKILIAIIYRVVNEFRLIVVKLRHHRLSIQGQLSLDRGVRFVITKSGRIILNGPIWLHRFTAFHAENGKLIIGKRTAIGPFTIIAAMDIVIIGENCMIAECVSIRDHDHNYADASIPMREQGWTIKPIRIGNNVWIGNKVTIMKGCTIGDNVIIGANSVVTKDIPSNSVAVGSPAKITRKLY